MDDMTSAQCRAARGLLKWTDSRLAEAADVSIEVIRDFENDTLAPPSAIKSLKHTLEIAGVDFMDGAASGVRLRPAPVVLRIDQLNASNDE